MAELLPYILSALVFMLLDVVSGLVKGMSVGNLSSKKAREGLYHKCGYILAIILAVMCEYATLSVELGIEIPLTIPVCVYICMTEILSVLENIMIINPDMSTFLSKYLKVSENGEHFLDEKK